MKNQLPIAQTEFNKINLLMRSNPLLYKQYLNRQIVNMYLLEPHGLGMSQEDIIKTLHIPATTIKQAVMKIAPKLWRDSTESIRLAAPKKAAAWKDQNSGYNTSPAMRHKTNYNRIAGAR